MELRISDLVIKNISVYYFISGDSQLQRHAEFNREFPYMFIPSRITVSLQDQIKRGY